MKQFSEDNGKQQKGEGQLMWNTGSMSRKAPPSADSSRPLKKQKSPELGHHHGGSFRVYMDHKIEKLRMQSTSDADIIPEMRDGDDSLTSLFAGVCIYVNGYNDPPLEHLKRLICRYGGQFEHYQTPRVTHMIATNLPDGKIREMRKARKPLPVVHPDWITDSIARKKVQAYQNYLVKGMRDRGQTSFAQFLTKKRDDKEASAQGNEGEDSLRPALQEGQKVPEEKVRTDEEENESGGETLVPKSDTPERRSAGGARVSPSPSSPSQLPPTSSISSPPVGLSVPYVHSAGFTKAKPASPLSPTVTRATESETEISRMDFEPEAAPVHLRTPPRVSASRALTMPEEREGLSPITSTSRPPSPSRYGGVQSTKTDPNFVEHFFKKSRLHHIGSWKMHYQNVVKEAQGDLDITAGSSRGPPTSSSSLSSSCTIVHVDMDCFFASVLTRDKPELQDKPVAIAHSSSSAVGGTSEISSCNYVAREFGVHASMFMAEAKRRCPDLVVLPYDFEKFSEVSDKIYQIFMRHAKKVQAVSCDEAFLELDGREDAEEVVDQIRSEIYKETRCTASAGISKNMLLARLATKRAKPNGQFYLRPEEAAAYLAPLSPSELPGVGWSLERKLTERGITTIALLRTIPLRELQSWVGTKTGQMLHDYCRGIDRRPLSLPVVRKSLGAEVNWGVRFTEKEEVLNFVEKIAVEVSNRLRECNLVGRTITLKMKRRKEPVEPVKFLGCGDCDNLSRAVTLNEATDSAEIIGRHAKKLCDELGILPEDVRGGGVQMTRLVPRTGDGKAEARHANLLAWMAKAPSPGPESAHQPGDQEDSASSGVEENYKAQKKKRPMVQEHVEVGKTRAEQLTSRPSPYELPTFSQLDPSVLQELPSTIREELVSTLQAHKQQDTRNQTDTRSAISHSELNSFSQIDPAVLAELPASLQAELKSSLTRPSVPPPTSPLGKPIESKGQSRPRGLLFKDEEFSASPSISQIRLLLDFCCSLVEKKRLEEVVAVLRLLRRKALSSFPGWIDGEKRIEEAVQKYMKVKYGAYLAL